MAVNLNSPQALSPVTGIRLGVAAAGIRRSGTDDVLLLECASGSTVAGVFTRNAFCAAPVTLARDHLRAGQVRYLLVNAGNANAGTGERGLADARVSCQLVADCAQVEAASVLPFSTGVIGEYLPMDKLQAGIAAAHAAMREDGWLAAASAIMTTDTVAKGVSEQVRLSGGTVTITGIAKGSGMIRPDMATMLGFIATDAVVPADELQRMLSQAVAGTFNRVTVDGDTSTNDACMLIATGATGIGLSSDEDRLALQQALNAVCLQLAQALVRDGEGATKFVTIHVSGARDEAEALVVAQTVAHSPLVKTALFASDANWGRILAAVGRAGVEALDMSGVMIRINEVLIAEGGQRAAGYEEAAGTAAMAEAEIRIDISLGRGNVSQTVWTSDLSHDYVRINAEYRT